jgi:quinol monooxygenase YgiN
MEEVRVIARADAREGKELFESNLPGILYFNELWQSQAHLDAHMASARFKEIFGEAKTLFKVALEVNRLKSIE